MPRWFLAAVLCCLAAPPAGAAIPVVELSGEIHPISAGFIVRAIEQAEKDGAPLLVLRLNTPGGLLASTRQIVDKILASRVPIAVFVGPSGARAASAGFIISISADVVAMAPGTNMGAAHPVSGLTGSGGSDEVMAKKMASDTAAYTRGKAEQRGRNAEMAEKAVLDSQSFTEREALQAHLIDYVVSDVDELLKKLDGKTIKRFDGAAVTLHLASEHTVLVEMTRREALLSAIASPDILFLLLLGALAGLGTELTHPGMLFPGIVGALCLVLFLFAAQIVPVSGAGVLLILLAVGLFAAEIKVPAYGLLTVSGIVAMILGAMMLVDTPARELQVSLRTVIPAALFAALWASVIVSLVLRAQHSPAVSGAEGMLGAVAQAETALVPEGWVRLRGERWRAIASGSVAVGEDVTVTSISGLTLHVVARPKEA